MSVSTWIIGPFTVRTAMRPDNPAFPCYVVLRDNRVVGKSFSVPDLDCCRWLERQTSEELVYASTSAPLPDKGREHTLRGLEKARAFSATRRRTTARFIQLAILEEEPT